MGSTTFKALHAALVSHHQARFGVLTQSQAKMLKLWKMFHIMQQIGSTTEGSTLQGMIQKAWTAYWRSRGHLIETYMIITLKYDMDGTVGIFRMRGDDATQGKSQKIFHDQSKT